MNDVRLWFRRRPLTFISITMISGYMIFLGLVLQHVTPGPSRIGSFSGPLTFMSLHMWGKLYIALGLVKLLRLLLFSQPFWSYMIHVLVSTVLVAWAASFYAGPLTTAMPSYTFIAILCVGLPFITPIARRYWLYIEPPRELYLES